MTDAGAVHLALVAASVDRGEGRDRVRALEHATVALRAGESLVVMGGSGSGKTTLALALAGLLPLAGGQRAGAALGRVGVALQRPEASFVRERVLDEVVAARTWAGESASAAAPAGRAALAELGFDAAVEARDPLALSGGEQRRVAIAAVLATAPRVVVLDEPAAGLDAESRAHLHRALGRLRADGRSLVVVTHDPAEAAILADRLLVLAGGRIAYDGPPGPVLGDPRTARSLGIDVAPEVAVLAAVAGARGHALPATDGSPRAAVAALAAHVRGEQLAAAAPGRVPAQVGAPSHGTAPHASAPPRAQPAAAPITLPPTGDPRLRLAAFALVVGATFVADSIAASAAVLGATVVATALVGVRAARLMPALRSMVLLGALLLVAQLVVGGAPEVALVGDQVVRSGPLAAARRIMQVLAVVFASLALTESTGPASLAVGLRTLLAPLRLLRVPVDDAALVSASGLGFVPVLADELDRLELAQRARGMHARRRGPLATLRLRSMLVVPLIVLAFRRAHLLAEALHARGYVRGARRTAWRPLRATPVDVSTLLAAALLLAVAWWA